MSTLHALVYATLLAATLAQDPAPPKDAPKDPVKERLEKSPRHHEWVEVKSGERTVHCFVAFPEVKEKTLAVLVIHENKGLNDWARAAADQFAEAGYIAIAPDLLSGAGPDGGRTDSFASSDDATKALNKLDGATLVADLNAVADHVTKLPACNGKLAVAGFCWGGAQTFHFAANRKGLEAACVFYGTPPKEEVLAKIESPVYGFYGENDARVTSTVAATTETMKKLGKTFEPVIHEGAGHGFMRSGEAPDASEANKKARDAAWLRLKKILSR
jgi:carboxymethylenebutenolidase